MNYPLLLQKAQQYIGQYFVSHVDRQLLYHSKSHTRRVVDAVEEIAKHYQLREHDFFVVTIAAWFHDMGYYSGKATEHEANGAAMAAAFLSQHGADYASIEHVKNCILVTRIPQMPTNLLEQIISDADLFHLGTKDFPALNTLMRKETEERSGKQIDKKLWRDESIAFLQSHHYLRIIASTC